MQPGAKLTFLFFIILSLSVLSSCAASDDVAEPTETPAAQTPIAEPTLTPAPLVPPNVNPLTGLYVEDPTLLDLPALLVSISHFPVTARPQAGLSFAPWVFEIYITEGATRFLTTFYGSFPEPENAVHGDCPVRREPIRQTSSLLGNRVWLDSNGDHMQDDWERGVGGICVTLYDEGGTPLAQTSTDSNGYYGFNVEAGGYILVFQKPARMEFTQKNIGDNNQDSDADPATGRTVAVEVKSTLLHVDAGLVLSSDPFPLSELPPAKVGPIRSGRLIYADIAAFFPDSCLIYAFASPEVLDKIPQCFFVTHDIDGGGYMLETNELKRLAQKSRDGEINYSSNIFKDVPPAGGATAARLQVYIAYLNQSAWVFDAASESYWRYVDTADPNTAGFVVPEVDRLTGRQLQFENVIILFAEHDVVSPTNLDIHLEENTTGYALLFRDGQMYDMYWSTQLNDDEKRTGRHRPVKFVNADDNTLMPLKPGRTWILVVTPETAVTERRPGEWLLQFHQPSGAK
ncbi:MAG: SdrD B-like domain-containing protein [Anaerolineales bacterium]|nr:MAG: SdrD B-like domain-containing protein [Anaerolineales bacterium]